MSISSILKNFFATKDTSPKAEHTKPEYIVCAAVWHKDPHDTAVPAALPKNCANGYVAYGRNHGQCLAQLRLMGIELSEPFPRVIGYLTSDNRFVLPEEALLIARAVKQIRFPEELSATSSVLTPSALY